MATTAKITEILNFKEWEWPHGKLYYIYMKLDNGETINLWKKKSDAFKVWDTVCYESAGDNKWREVKEEYKPKAEYSNGNLWAVVGMALKIAFECYYDKKEENFEATIALAHRIMEEAINMAGGDEETAKNDSLPF